MNKGKRLSREGRRAEALKIFKDVAQSSDNYHVAHYHVGLEMIALGLFEDALKRFDRPFS